jgi:hypothetical protein
MLECSVQLALDSGAVSALRDGPWVVEVAMPVHLLDLQIMEVPDLVVLVAGLMQHMANIAAWDLGVLDCRDYLAQSISFISPSLTPVQQEKFYRQDHH